MIFLFFFGLSRIPITVIAALMGVTALSAIIIANELRRPIYREYNRKKALYPKIPEKYLATVPPPGSVVLLILPPNRHILAYFHKKRR